MRTIFAAVLSLLISATFGQNWTSFRGDRAGEPAEGSNLPAVWDIGSGQNIRWKTEIPGMAHSSPILWDGVVYVTTAVVDHEVELATGDVDSAGIDSASDQKRHRWMLWAVDRDTGQVLWKKTAHEGIPKMKRHVKASHSSQTPTTDGRRIVALFGSEGLFCFDMSGNFLWKVDVGLLDVGLWGQPDVQWGPASSPVIFRNLVFVQNDRQKESELLAFNLSDGSRAWRVARSEKPSWSTPLLFSGARDELITNSGNFFRAYDPLTGKELWRLSNNDSQVITPSPIAGRGLVVITGAYPAGGNPIYAIRPGGNGELSQEPVGPGQPGLVWKIDRGSPYTPTPIIYQGILYVCTDNGVLSAYELETGTRLYRVRLAAGAGVSASPVASGGRLYFPSEDGDVYVVRAGRKYELLAANDLGEVLLATPAISEDMLVIRGRTHLFGIREAPAE